MGINTMRNIVLVGCAVAAMLGSASAEAQYYGGIPTGRTLLPACYDPSFQYSPSRLPIIIPYADQAMNKYLGLARARSSLDKMFTGTRGNRLMLIDGVQVDPRTAKDPWAHQIVKLEPVGYVQSNEALNTLAQWRAISSNGTLLGTYHGLLRGGIGGYHFRQLMLTSAGSQMHPGELKPFCMTPGDIEEWQAKKAEREAKRSAKGN
jgi:hypothetical protein